VATKKATDEDPRLEEKEDWWFSLSAGLSDAEIAARFSVTPEQAKSARDGVIAAQVAHLTLPIPDQYAHYRSRMEGMVRRLDAVHRKALTGKRPQLKTASDAAVAMARIVDRTIERGQELGVLPRAVAQKSTKVTVSGGVMLGAMTAQELSTKIAEMAREGRRLRENYAGGDTQFTALPDPNVYEADPIEEVQPEAPRIIRRKH
jgi:hypothetical protein